MTTLALPAETAVMHIVPIVTTAATPSQTDLAAHRPFVTGLAGESQVTTIELEVALPVVIEYPCLPVTRVVTQPALRSQGAFVRIVPGVAGAAF